MRRSTFIVIASLMIVLSGALAASAGRGKGPGNCTGINCTGPLLICSGEVRTVEGTVLGYVLQGGGLTVATTEGLSETFYGVGPVWYWERNRMDRPEVGEHIALTVESVTIGGGTREVIITITLGDGTIVLRDQTTCLPLWRGSR